MFKVYGDGDGTSDSGWVTLSNIYVSCLTICLRSMVTVMVPVTVVG